MKNPVVYLLSCVLFVCFAPTLPAQKITITPGAELPVCAAAELQEQVLATNPKIKKAWLDSEAKAYQSAIQSNQRRQANYTLPVVIHIIHDNGSENLTDAQVSQGIEHLNEAFANSNYYDQGTGVNTNIEFCLASRAPDGTATSGINRVQSTLTDSSPSDDLALKNLSRWDPLQYINIWLVRELCLGANCGLAGYANFPALHGQDEDGIVMEARWFGSSNGNSGVQIHEMGHYLGLYHTFQGSCVNNDCAFDGDRVCDTPPDQSTAVVPCGASANSCSTDTNSGFASDQDDMYWNYMDYGDWDCYSAFTQGQTDRMTFFIENSRNSLLSSEGCKDPCPISADLSIDSAPAQVQVGTMITFTLTAPMLSQFEWFINNVSVGTGPSLTYTFANKGNYIISVEGGNGNPLCAGFDFIEVEVICPVIADFTASAAQVFVNESVLFTSSSINAVSLSWYIDGILVNTSTSFSEVFTEEGNYEVFLVAENAICSDTSALFFVFVAHPCGEGGTKLIRTQGARPSQIRKLADGGLIVLYKGGFGTPYEVTRLDNNQSLVWVKMVNSLDGVEIRDVVEDPSDNGLLFCGSVEEQSESSGYIFKLDANGNYLWGHRTTLEDRRFNYIYPAPGGDFLVAGHIEVIPNDSVQIVKIQTDGTILWSKTYTGIELTDFEVMSDGSMYFSGDLDFYPNSFSSAALTHLDSDGNILWASRYTDPALGNAFHFRFSSIKENDVGGVMLGYSVQDPSYKKYDVLISLDGDGDIQWQNRYYYFYQRTGFETEGPVNALTQTPDGGFVFYSTLSNDLLSVLTKIDAQGNLLWSRNISTAFNLYYNGSPRIEIMDNGNLVVGHNGRLFILDANGLLGPCPLVDVPAEINGINLFKESVNMQQFGPVTFIPTSGNTVDGAFNPVLSCETQSAMQPDAEVTTIDAGFCNGMYTLNWQLCNIGTGTIPSGTPYTLYDGNPTIGAAPVLLSQTLSTDLTPGDCRTIQTALSSLPTNEVHIIFNDNGSLTTPFDLIDDLSIIAIPIECNFFNNIDSLSLANISISTPLPFLGNDTIICSNESLPLGPGIFSAYLWQDGSNNDSLTASVPGNYSVTVTDACGQTQVDDINIQWLTSPSLDLGPDVMLCENAVLPLDAGPDFETYQWSDGSKDQQITAWLEGTYFVEATDACGGVQRDTVILTFDPATILDLPLELNACTGANLAISVPGYLDYQWSPGGILDCDDCATVNLTADQDRTFYLLVETAAGCFSSDSVNVIVQDTVNTFEQIPLCTGDSAFIFGAWEKVAGTYSQTVLSSFGCDSTHVAELILLDTLLTTDQVNICQGDSAFIFGGWEKMEGSYSQTFPSSFNCDSTHTVELIVLDTSLTFDQINICTGDSAFIFGTWEKVAGDYSQTVLSSFGCDSTHIVDLIVLDSILTTDQVSHCQGDSTLLFGTWEKEAGLYSQTLPSSFGCDSTHTVELIVVDTFLMEEVINICQGDSVFIFGAWEKVAGNYSQTLPNSFGCDSTNIVELMVLDTSATNALISICEGDSALIFGLWKKTAGTYSQTLTNSFGCDSTEFIELMTAERVESAEQFVLCAGDSVLVFGEWVFNSGTFMKSFPITGACDSLHQISVLVADEIALEAEPEWTIAPGDSIALVLDVLSDMQNWSFEWSPAAGLSCTDCLSPIASPLQSTNYQLLVTDEQGCTAFVELLVRVEEKERAIYLPTAFSPNDDLANDILFPQGLDGSATILRFAIYDRWGEVVFENTNFALNDSSQGWDGTFKKKPMMTGVYVAVLEVLWLDGKRDLLNSGVALIR